MAKYKIGLENVKLGAIAGDGGMGTVLTNVGNTVEGSATLTTEEGQKTDFKIEESDSPIMSISTEADTMSLSWSSYDCDATQLQRMFGGTVVPATSATGETWQAPDVIPEIEQSLEAIWKNGDKLQIPRAKIKASLAMSFNRGTLSQINITATVLQPTKVGEPRMSVIAALS